MTQKAEGDTVFLSMGAPGGREVFVQPHLVMPKPKDEDAAKAKKDAARAKEDPKEKGDDEMFVSYFWAVPIANAANLQDGKCNMAVEFETVRITSMDVKVPDTTNTAPLDVGDHLIVEPYNKKPKRA